MAELIYPKIYLKRVAKELEDKEVLEILRGYLNKAIAERDKKPDTYKYYPDVNSPLRIESLINENKKYDTKNVIISGIDQPYSFIRFAFQKLKIGERHIHIKEPDVGLQRGHDGKYVSFVDRQFHDDLLEGCGMRKQPIKLFTDDFWKKMVGIHPKKAKNLTHTIVVDQKKYGVNIDSFAHNSTLGILQYTPHRLDDGKGTLSTYILDVEFKTRLGAAQGRFFLLGIHEGKVDGDEEEMDETEESNSASSSSQATPPVQRLSKEEQMATRGKGFGVGGTLLDIDAVMKEKKYIPFDSLEKTIWLERKVNQEWKSYCLFCGELYTLLGFHPDITWIAATCGCQLHKRLHAWEGDNFFRLVLAYDYMTNRTRDNFDFNSQPLIIMTKGLTPHYSSLEEFKQTACAAEVVEQKLVYRTTASKFKLATIVDVSHELQSRKFSETQRQDKSFPMEHLRNIRFSMPAEVDGGLWTSENRPSIKKVCIVPQSSVPVYGHPTAKSMDSCSDAGLVGDLDRIMKIGGNQEEGIEARTIVEIRVWVPDVFPMTENSPFYLVPRPPTSYITSLKKAVNNWDTYLTQREAVTLPETTCITTASPIVVVVDSNVKEMEKSAFVPGSAHIVRFVVNRNYVTDDFKKCPPSPCVHFGLILFNNNELNDEQHTFNGVLRKVEDHKNAKNKVIVTAIVEYQTKDIILDNPVTVSMWTGRDAKDKKLMQIMNERTFLLEDMGRCTADNKIESDWDFFKMIRPCPVKSLVDLRDFLLYNTVSRVHHFKRPTSERKIEAHQLHNYEKLNSSQAEATVNVLNSPLALVQGPPGCGKTFTLVAIVNEIFNQQSTKGGMVLIVCPTNHACKVTKKMMKNISGSQLKQLKVRRLMAFGKEVEKPEEKADGYVHSAMLNHSAYWSNPEALEYIKLKQNAEGRNLLSEKQEEVIATHLTHVRNLVLDETDVLICTVNTANNETLQTYFNGNRKESKNCLGVAVDESNLISVPQMLALLGLNPKYFALIGDHRQLSKFYNSRTAMNANAQTCLMRFLTASDYMKAKDAPKTLLREQYRYPKDLCRLISALYYENLLVSSPSVMERQYGSFPNPLFYDQFPAFTEGSILRVIYDESSAVEEEDEFSYFNAKEIEIVAGLVKDIVESDILQKKITVLSMYMSHLKKIKEAIQTDYPDVAVCTVDSYEGKEQSIIILSMVRCNEKSDIGFLRQGERLNVGFSRAQDYLFYVSAEETFKKSKIPQIEYLYQLMDDFEIPKITK